MSKILLMALFFLWLLFFTYAHAGKKCTEYVPDVNEFYHASKMALRLEQELESRKSRLALVGRVGGDLSQYGLKYTHMGYVFKKQGILATQWTFLHELNECGSPYSSLYEQGMVNFFLDDLKNMDIVVVLPKKQLQEKILGILKHSASYPYHHKDYSMLANPFSLKYQNSNQWMMEILAAAQGGIRVQNRREAQVFLQKQHFQPQWVKILPAKRLGAALFGANVRFDDHDSDEKKRNRFKTVSVKSIVDYFLSQNIAQQIFEISEQGKVIQFLKPASVCGRGSIYAC